MGEEESERRPAPCQGIFRWDEPCLIPATRHCERCASWFCQAHFSDPDWHPCGEESPYTVRLRYPSAFGQKGARGVWRALEASAWHTLMNARAAARSGNVARQITRTSVPIQPELFAQNAGPKKCQEMPLYLKKRNEYRLGAGRSCSCELADGIHHR